MMKKTFLLVFCCLICNITFPNREWKYDDIVYNWLLNKSELVIEFENKVLLSEITTGYAFGGNIGYGFVNNFSIRCNFLYETTLKEVPTWHIGINSSFFKDTLFIEIGLLSYSLMNYFDCKIGFGQRLSLGFHNFAFSLQANIAYFMYIWVPNIFLNSTYSYKSFEVLCSYFTSYLHPDDKIEIGIGYRIGKFTIKMKVFWDFNVIKWTHSRIITVSVLFRGRL